MQGGLKIGIILFRTKPKVKTKARPSGFHEQATRQLFLVKVREARMQFSAYMSPRFCCSTTLTNLPCIWLQSL